MPEVATSRLPASFFGSNLSAPATYNELPAAEPPPPPGARKACLIGANPSGKKQAWGRRPQPRHHKGEPPDLAHLEQRLASALFRANDLLPREEEEEPKKKVRESASRRISLLCGRRSRGSPSASREPARAADGRASTISKNSAGSESSALPSGGTASPVRASSLQLAAAGKANRLGAASAPHSGSAGLGVPGEAAPPHRATFMTPAGIQERNHNQLGLSGNSEHSGPSGEDGLSQHADVSPCGEHDGSARASSLCSSCGATRRFAGAAKLKEGESRSASELEAFGSMVATAQEPNRRQQKTTLSVPTYQTLLRQLQEETLTKSLSLADGSDEGSASLWQGDESDRPSLSVIAARRTMRFLCNVATPAFGVLPWSKKYLWLSTLYQWLVLLLLAGGSASCSKTAYEKLAEDDSAAVLVSVMDSVLAMGALVGLSCMGAYWRSARLTKSVQLLRSYSVNAGYPYHWEGISRVDFACTLCLWLAAVLWRVKETVLHLEAPALDAASFAFSSAVLLGISSFVLHACRFLTRMTDVFCSRIIDHPDFSEALQEWSLLQALCRATCNSIQLGFLALQATTTAAVLLSITQVGRRDTSRLIGLVPSLVIALAVVRTSVWAAGLTDKCARVPMLVNSITAGPDLDQQRMYCVQHILHSQAGFYIFDLRLNSSTIMKTIYVACAMAFGLATQVL